MNCCEQEMVYQSSSHNGNRTEFCWICFKCGKCIAQPKEEKNLLKIILFHCHWGEQILAKIFNHYVEIVIVENGKLTFTKILNCLMNKYA
jgi:hypothetical protein